MGEKDEETDEFPAAQRPGRAHHATEQGHPLQHLKQQQSNTGDVAEDNPGPTPTAPVQNSPPTTQTPQRQPEQTQKQYGGGSASAQPQQHPPAAEGDASGSRKTMIIVAAVIGLLVVGSCCVVSGLIAILTLL